ncbi:hypothetical protein [Reichenbachiella agariperforans]|uniref:Tellurite resistance protein TerB n=1 Tax=Reichenbachiella agariperforans TaxID=156994 RepID=A0A1M6U9T0_REIAG|nr:hypothetical protein [Reichenbachiella agariperforans]MBU2912539.1 TerB family tellurite resistance protein [Reichenbachiella agariperforans]SHK65921.1 hypothetical protein SAMN04488028_10726 [Reichenbachiella agariperforans]
MSDIHLNILIQLAKIDGIVVQEEIDLINEVGKANGLTEEEIMAFYDQEMTLENLSELKDDEKYELIYSVVQLMKIDGKLYNEEIKYCAKMAARLGYDENVLFELMLKIYADPDLCADKESLKKEIQKFLIS